MNKLTNTQEEYFANSQVRDRHSDLLVVYHGSKTKGLNRLQYDPNRQSGEDFGEAYYFTTDYEIAKAYTYDAKKDKSLENWNKRKNAMLDKYEETKDTKYLTMASRLTINGMDPIAYANLAPQKTNTGEVYEMYLNLENPLVVEANEGSYYNIYKECFKEAKEKGHDGIIVKNVCDSATGRPKPTDVYIAFYQDQFKSIDNKYPTKSAYFKESGRECLKETPEKLELKDHLLIANNIREEDKQTRQDMRIKQKELLSNLPEIKISEFPDPKDNIQYPELKLEPISKALYKGKGDRDEI